MSTWLGETYALNWNWWTYYSNRRYLRACDDSTKFCKEY